MGPEHPAEIAGMTEKGLLVELRGLLSKLGLSPCRAELGGSFPLLYCVLGKWSCCLQAPVLHLV